MIKEKSDIDYLLETMSLFSFSSVERLSISVPQALAWKKTDVLEKKLNKWGGSCGCAQAAAASIIMVVILSAFLLCRYEFFSIEFIAGIICAMIISLLTGYVGKSATILLRRFQMRSVLKRLKLQMD